MSRAKPLEEFPSELSRRWANLRNEQPPLRQREAAKELGVSEGELVASELGARAQALRPEWVALLTKLGAVGPVMALTRNEHAVIECVGVYENVEGFGAMGQVVGKAIDLRLFFRRWHAAFAFRAPTPANDSRPSLQIFDPSGQALHKVFLTKDSDESAWHALVAEFQGDTPTFSADVAAEALPKPDAEVDRGALLEGWRNLRDTHEFSHLLRRLGIARTQALRLATPEWAQPAPLGAWRAVLEGASQHELPVMTFVGSPGAIQIHTGAVRNIKLVGDWFNIIQPGFNLHLHEPGVTQAWVVRKPTAEGTVTSLELYDAQGETVLLSFCKRRAGEAEPAVWRELLAGVSRIPV